MTRDEVAAAVRTRLETALNAGLSVGLLDDGAVSEAAALTKAAESGDFEAAYLLGTLHWLRYQTAPEGQGQADQAAAIRWFGLLLPHVPEAVPEPLWSMLATSVPPAGDNPEAWVAEAIRLLLTRRTEPADQLLDRSIDLFQQALIGTPVDSPDLAVRASNLGVALQTRFERAGDRRDLVRAIDFGTVAVESTPVDHPDRAGRMSNLGIALQRRFEVAGNGADLDKAIELASAAVESTPVDHPDRAGRMSNLGIALQRRFEVAGNGADLDKAIELASAAVESTPVDHPDRAGRMSNLGIALQRRFEVAGNGADLDKAIELASAAVESTPVDHPDRAAQLSNLAVALQRRFDFARNGADLDNAIELATTAVESTPIDHPDRAKRLSNMGVVLQRRFEVARNGADLDKAIELATAAVESTPIDHPDRATRLANLGAALHDRTNHAEESTEANARPDTATPHERQISDEGDITERFAYLGRVLNTSGATVGCYFQLTRRFLATDLRILNNGAEAEIGTPVNVSPLTTGSILAAKLVSADRNLGVALLEVQSAPLQTLPMVGKVHAGDGVQVIWATTSQGRPVVEAINGTWTGEALTEAGLTRGVVALSSNAAAASISGAPVVLDDGSVVGLCLATAQGGPGQESFIYVARMLEVIKLAYDEIGDLTSLLPESSRTRPSGVLEAVRDWAEYGLLDLRSSLSDLDVRTESARRSSE